MKDWKKEIAIAHLVKQRVAELDLHGLWPHCLPELAASPDGISEVERRVGRPLDAKYGDFLQFANGWKAFFHSIDLFGTAELIESDRFNRAMKLLESLEPLHPICGLYAGDLLPIAVSANSIDVFVIDQRRSPEPGEVIWLAGQVIDRFPDFDEFFLAMVDYNRAEARLFLEQTGPPHCD